MFKRLFWVLVLWLCCLGAAEAIQIPVKQISRQELHSLIPLSGNWKLKGPDGKEFLARVPGPWERYYKPKFITHMGQGVYELELKLPQEAKGQYFKIYTNLAGGEHFSCKLNGQEIARNGFRSDSTSRVIQVFPFKVEQTDLHLKCNIQNLKLYNSGLIRPVYFGRADLIERWQLREKMLTNFNIGVFLFLALFHILLYAGYRQEIGLLWFALLSLSLGAFGEFYHARNIEYFFTEVPVEVSSFITRLALFSVMPAFILYVYATAPQRQKAKYLKPWFIKLVLGINLAFMLSILLPIQLYTIFTILWMLINMLYTLYNIWRLKVFVSDPQTYLYAGSNLLFSVGMIFDNLNGLGILPFEFMSRYMMMLFCLLQAIFLSRRMQQNYQQAVSLQQELSEVNQNLEGLISERTQEIRSKNEQLQKLVSFKDEMTRMIVHDLKAPLNTLMNLPAQQIALSEERRHSFENASKRILGLVENMLQLKQADEPGLRPHTSLVSLQRAADQVLLGLGNWAQSKKIKLINQLEPGLSVQADAGLLERVLLNICDNAIKHTPIGGEICLGANQQGESVQIWVDDTGHGFSPQALDKAFEKNQSFAQGQTPRSSGLGLYFCRQVIEAHGGGISLQNRSPYGARVLIELPLHLPAQLVLESEDLQRLGPVLADLQRLEVFEVSDLQALLLPLRQDPGPGLKAWLERFDRAIYEVNEEAYAELLAQVTAPADC